MKLPSISFLALAMGLMSQPLAFGQKMQKAEEPEEVGLTSVGDAYFPNPGDLPGFEIPNGNFEVAPNNGDILQTSRFITESSDQAPEGKSFLIQEGKAVATISLTAPAREGVPYLVSVWLRTSAAASSGMATSKTDEIYYGKNTPLDVPDTGGAWKRVGFYFRTAPGTTGVNVMLRFSGGEAVAIDDIRFREATEDEFAKAYAGWRAKYPSRDLSPRPDDGKNLSLFLSKLTHPDPSQKTIKIMGIGSSYTNMLGNGERLVQWIREKYPKAPPVLYEKHVGSAVEFDYTRGWMRQHVLSKQPDLVILYSGGNAGDLEKLLRDFRERSAADVIVASLHLRERDEVVSDATINAPEWDEIRDVALKYGCEWVDSRREWGGYLRENGQPIEWLLKDAVHQSDHGALVINENICRHLVPNEAPSYRPEDRERFLKMEAAAEGQEGTVASEGGSLALRFRGNRIDLIGRKSADGGTLGTSGPITIDGTPLDELPAFVTTLIVPGAKNHRPERGSTADRSPHLITLGEPAKVVPQSWMIRMYGDAGAYELIGSVTGHDGYGHNGENLTSNSGQILVPTDLWRRRLESDGETYTNRDGDTFSWEVHRATTPTVSFQGRAGEVFSVTLADQLSNGWHELTIPIEGVVCDILGVHVFEPPLGRSAP